jgi:hypothetical protein
MKAGRRLRGDSGARSADPELPWATLRPIAALSLGAASVVKRVPVTCSWLSEPPPMDENGLAREWPARPAVAWMRSAGAWCREPAGTFGLGVPRHHPYHDLGGRYFDERDRHTVERRLVARLEGLGYTVSLDPAA